MVEEFCPLTFTRGAWSSCLDLDLCSNKCFIQSLLSFYENFTFQKNFNP